MSVLNINIVSGQKIKQWKRPFPYTQSKTNLVKYIAQDWQKPQGFMKALMKEQMLQIVHAASAEYESLTSLQKEADTGTIIMCSNHHR